MVNEHLGLNGVVIGAGAYRNFSGAMKFGKAGKRTFTILLKEDKGLEVEADGWHVRWRDPRDEQEGRTALLDVEVRYDKYPPKEVKLTTGNDTRNMTEENIGLLDEVDIDNKSSYVELRPFNWEVNGKTGVKAYLYKLHVTQKEYAKKVIDC